MRESGAAIATEFGVHHDTARNAIESDQFVLRTPWRHEVVALLERRGFTGTVVIPEYRSLSFNDGVARQHGHGDSPVRHMRAASHAILARVQSWR